MTPHQHQQQHRDASALAALALLAAMAALAALSAGCASAPPCEPKVVYQTVTVPIPVPIPPPPAIRPPEIVTPACGPGDTVQQMETTALANDAEIIRWALDEAAALKEWKALAERPQAPPK
jgi:hypothetical protein